MRVCLTGTHGVGKSSILEGLKDKLSDYTIQFSSLTREVVQSSSQLNNGTTIETQKLLQEKYLECFKNAPLNYISPRCLLDVFAYTCYFGLEDSKRSGITRDFIFEQREAVRDNIFKWDLVFYVPIEFNLAKKDLINPFREGQQEEKYRIMVDQIIVDMLKHFKVDYITLTGTIEERVGKVLEVMGDKEKK